MLPNRQSIRLPDYDYSQNGLYFVTICTFERQYLFGDIVVGINHNSSVSNMVLNESSKIVNSVWQSLSNRFPIKLDTFQIMPNHVHMIINIVGAIHESPDSIHESPDLTRAHRDDGANHDSPLRKRSLLSQCIGYFKMNSAKLIHQINPKTKIWQRNFYEHIIRNDWELFKIRKYIQTNPQTWNQDRNNLNQW